MGSPLPQAWVTPAASPVCGLPGAVTAGFRSDSGQHDCPQGLAVCPQDARGADLGGNISRRGQP